MDLPSSLLRRLVPREDDAGQELLKLLKDPFQGQVSRSPPIRDAI